MRAPQLGLAVVMAAAGAIPTFGVLAATALDAPSRPSAPLWRNESARHVTTWRSATAISTPVTRQLGTTATFVDPDIDVLQAAMDAADPGDALVLRDGVYTSSTQLPFVLEITKNITIRAEHHGRAVIDGGHRRMGIKISEGLCVVLEGLNVTNGSATLRGGGIQVGPSSWAMLNSCNVYSNTVLNNAGGGLFVEDDSHVELNNKSLQALIKSSVPTPW